MPLPVRWSTFKEDKVSAEENYYGVYELGDNRGQIVYIGQGRVRDRLISHLIGKSHPIERAAKYRKAFTGGKQKAEEGERAELRAYANTHNGYLPPYNNRLG